MTGVLIDFCVLSELVKKTPAAALVQSIARLSDQQVKFHVAATTLESAYFFLAQAPNHKKQWLLEKLLDQFEPALALTGIIAQRAGILRGQFTAAGVERSTQDMVLAATAQTHQLIMLTRNVNAFAGCGIQALNPFETQ